MSDDILLNYTVHAGALDPASGATLWRWRGTQHPRPGQAQQLTLAAALSNVYLGTRDSLYGFRGDDGGLLWTTPAGFDVVRMAPALTRGGLA
jgi:outer membrane protein assembly factor BamB